MTIKRIKLSEALNKKGKTRVDILNKISNKEIHRRALNDPDNPPLTESQLKEFILATNKKDKNNEKK